MIVVDASIIVELLTDSAFAEAFDREVKKRSEPLIVPHLLDVEVASALRKLAAMQRVEPHRGERFLTALSSFPATRQAHTGLLPRIWELRHNFTAYDAAYIALAEATGSVLFTCDEKLSKGHRAQVVLFST